MQRRPITGVAAAPHRIVVFGFPRIALRRMIVWVPPGTLYYVEEAIHPAL